MDWVKSTKGAHVYANNEPNAPVSTGYIQRSELPPNAPVNLTLTIEYEEESNHD